MHGFSLPLSCPVFSVRTARHLRIRYVCLPVMLTILSGCGDPLSNDTSSITGIGETNDYGSGQVTSSLSDDAATIAVDETASADVSGNETTTASDPPQLSGTPWNNASSTPDQNTSNADSTQDTNTGNSAESSDQTGADTTNNGNTEVRPSATVASSSTVTFLSGGTDDSVINSGNVGEPTTESNDKIPSPANESETIASDMNNKIIEPDETVMENAGTSEPVTVSDENAQSATDENLASDADANTTADQPDAEVIDETDTDCGSGGWYTANLTYYTSYPDPGSEECLYYNGCTWAGQFAGLNGVQPESWVQKNNIAAVHSKDFNWLNGKTLRLRQAERVIDVVVYDMCADSDCQGCCSANLGGDGYLIDIESYTMERFGSSSGLVEWQICNL